MSQRTITLTKRPPVKIQVEDWPVLAHASDKAWDNQYEFQANRTEKVWIMVRQHSDGRTIVYAGYDYSTAFQNERDARYKAGSLLPSGDAQHICDEIEAVTGRMPLPQLLDDCVWDTLASECIADMPPEVI